FLLLAHLAVSLLLSGSGDPRDLPSFPTRRSSDLIRLLSVFDVTRFAEFRDYVMTVLMLDTGMRCSEASFLLLDDINLKGYSIYIDRKSTRLNSSHVKISYAVFCLKKKKQKQTQES